MIARLESLLDLGSGFTGFVALNRLMGLIELLLLWQRLQVLL